MSCFLLYEKRKIVEALRAVESVGKIPESLILERATRIELAPQPWEGCILPLNYARDESIFKLKTASIGRRNLKIFSSQELFLTKSTGYIGKHLFNTSQNLIGFL